MAGAYVLRLLGCALWFLSGMRLRGREAEGGFQERLRSGSWRWEKWLSDIVHQLQNGLWAVDGRETPLGRDELSIRGGGGGEGGILPLPPPSSACLAPGAATALPPPTAPVVSTGYDDGFDTIPSSPLSGGVDATADASPKDLEWAVHLLERMHEAHVDPSELLTLLGAQLVH